MRFGAHWNHGGQASGCPARPRKVRAAGANSKTRWCWARRRRRAHGCAGLVGVEFHGVRLTTARNGPGDKKKNTKRRCADPALAVRFGAALAWVTAEQADLFHQNMVPTLTLSR